jgi:Ca-activated chloride channel family protein
MLRDAQPTTDDTSTGGRLVALDGRTLPLLSAHVRAEARGGIARTVLVQTFRNPHAEPLQVTYLFPLPHHGAVSAFAFRLDGRRVVGEVDRLQRARERFEEAVLEGRTAALLEQERGSLFTRQLGNVPPGATVEAELAVDQRLDWRPAEGGWEWRFPTVVAPRYAGAPGRVEDAGRIAVPVAESLTGRADAPGASPALGLELAVHGATGRPESPTHPIAAHEAAGVWRVALSGESPATLDRDVAIRWPAAAPEVGLSLDAHAAPEPGRLAGRAFGLLTVVPPTPAARPRPVPRDLIVLVDASGSMSGEPIDQARRVIGALVDSLGEEDQLELVSFANEPLRWKRGPAAATAANRREAHRWLSKLQAAGGTEMREGIRAALQGLREGAQRQVVLVTDGLIGFEQEVVAEIRDALPAGSRVHTVGVGSGVNRSLTGPAARAGRGLEVILGLGEDPERAAAALRARTTAPLVTDLRLSGTALRDFAPAKLPDLFAGAPALLSVELDPAGGTLVLQGRTADGPIERTLTVPRPVPGNAAVAALFGREAVEDLETARAAGAPDAELDAEVEQLGLAFQLSTRLTAWVAVSEEPTVDPTRPTRREEVPQLLPHGMSAEGLGLRGASAPYGAATAVMPSRVAGGPPPAPMRSRELAKASPAPAAKAKKGLGLFRSALGGVKEEAERGRADVVDHMNLPPEDGAVRRLAAKVKAVKDRLVFEIALEDATFEWIPPLLVHLCLRDGTRVPVNVDRHATTAAGELGRGSVLRLVTERGAIDPAAIEEVALEIDGTPLLLTVAH